MKVKQDVLNHKSYSHIIKAILNGRNYAETIANYLELKSPSILPHLKDLKKKGFLKKEKIKRFNKSIYKVNPKKILEIFINYCYEIDDFKALSFYNKSDFLQSELLSNFLIACLKNVVHHPSNQKQITLKDDFTRILSDLPIIESNFKDYKEVDSNFKILIEVLSKIDVKRLIASLPEIIDDFEKYTFKTINSSK